MLREMLFGVALCWLVLVPSARGDASSRCLLVNSYNSDYAWQRAVTKSIWLQLMDQCEIRELNMNAKHYPHPEQLQRVGREAWQLIQQWHPNVVIACDDAASRFLVEPYLKNGDTPVVFCGVNLSGEAYGYPYSNATGMLEVDSTEQLFSTVKQMRPQAQRGVLVMVERMTDNIMAPHYRQLARQQGLELEIRVVKSMDGLEQAYERAQATDFLYFYNNAGMEDWDERRALQIAQTHAGVLTLSAYRWLAPFVMLTIAHVPEEMGSYVGRTALRILQGTSPAEIPITQNTQVDVIVNQPLLNRLGLKLPPELVEQAMVIEY
ncbi:ABC transporter substrate-binding protein [Aestuariirhabdus litorea]|uniref:ABC transporter substrate-binding protein n=1 Tax=Aestuariirhabdus litorea TaxID=2528527 RepID=A0A3P3VQB3_9GAMM|nr:ABC transporter substrate binding protein [Aestuariirhabdus litorea]RRJ83779.1 hypothetical protein D0544_01260 [Aestuariirhabdus litorea]RWW97002.1 hypothetical protein DZC74_01260 [Endozoicomonadaceae bacterium GTF-13]